MTRTIETLTINECLTFNMSDGKNQKLGYGESLQEIGECNTDNDTGIDNHRAQTEISASIRTLKTNLVMISTFILVFLIYFLIQSWTCRVVIVTFCKGLVPIMTTIANFGKIRSVLAMYYEQLTLRCIKRVH